MARANLARKQGIAVQQLTTFAAGISASPETYLVPPGEAAALQAAVDEAAELYARAHPKAMRTKADVAAKDEAFARSAALYRRWYSAIKWNPSIADQDKLRIGVRPVNRERRRKGKPRAAPIIGITKATAWVHHLVFHAKDTPRRKAKPEGAVGLQLFVAVADGPVTKPGEARLRGMYTRSRAQVKHATAARAKTATYFARYVSAKGEAGPYSAPASMVIAA